MPLSRVGSKRTSERQTEVFIFISNCVKKSPNKLPPSLKEFCHILSYLGRSHAWSSYLWVGSSVYFKQILMWKRILRSNEDIKHRKKMYCTWTTCKGTLCFCLFFLIVLHLNYNVSLCIINYVCHNWNFLPLPHLNII